MSEAKLNSSVIIAAVAALTVITAAVVVFYQDYQIVRKVSWSDWFSAFSLR